MTTDTERTTRRRDRAQLVAFLAAFAVVAVVAVCVAAFGFAVLRGFVGDESPGAVPFESQAWHDPANRDMRRRMAIDLVENEQLVHLNEDEVHDLLGEPGSHGYLPPWSYRVGTFLGGEYRRGLTFDDAGNVNRAEIASYRY